MWPLKAFPGEDGLFWLGWDLLPGVHGEVSEEDGEEDDWDDMEDEGEDWEDEGGI